MVTASIAILGIVGFVFGLGLSVAALRLRVAVDARLAKVLSVLPDTNCGACGYAGCSGFARAVVEGTAAADGCRAGGAGVAHSVADVLGVEAQLRDPVVAVVHCKGGAAEAREQAGYVGIEDCWAAILVASGTKVCQEGCLGRGTCVEACPFGAIAVTDNRVAQVDHGRCTGCGLCARACPRSLISLVPRAHKVFLACASHERGAEVAQYCSVGCTSCNVCVEATTSGAIAMRDGLPVLDYTAHENFVIAVSKCPQHCFTDLVRARPKANIDMACDGCGDCVRTCPVDAISGKAGERHVIDKNVCIGCGVCLNTCHIHAIKLWGGLGYASE